MADKRFEVFSEDHIAPVYDIHTGEELDAKAVRDLERNAGGLVRNFCDTELWDDNVVSLDDARRARLEELPISHLGKFAIKLCPPEVPIMRLLHVTGQIPSPVELL